MKLKYKKVKEIKVLNKKDFSKINNYIKGKYEYDTTITQNNLNNNKNNEKISEMNKIGGKKILKYKKLSDSNLNPDTSLLFNVGDNDNQKSNFIYNIRHNKYLIPFLNRLHTKHDLSFIGKNKIKVEGVHNISYLYKSREENEQDYTENINYQLSSSRLNNGNNINNNYFIQNNIKTNNNYNSGRQSIRDQILSDISGNYETTNGILNLKKLNFNIGKKRLYEPYSQRFQCQNQYGKYNQFICPNNDYINYETNNCNYPKYYNNINNNYNINNDYNNIDNRRKDIIKIRQNSKYQKYMVVKKEKLFIIFFNSICKAIKNYTHNIKCLFFQKIKQYNLNSTKKYMNKIFRRLFISQQNKMKRAKNNYNIIETEKNSKNENNKYLNLSRSCTKFLKDKNISDSKHRKNRSELFQSKNELLEKCEEIKKRKNFKDISLNMSNYNTIGSNKNLNSSGTIKNNADSFILANNNLDYSSNRDSLNNNQKHKNTSLIIENNDKLYSILKKLNNNRYNNIKNDKGNDKEIIKKININKSIKGVVKLNDSLMKKKYVIKNIITADCRLFVDIKYINYNSQKSNKKKYNSNELKISGKSSNFYIINSNKKIKNNKKFGKIIEEEDSFNINNNNDSN